MVATNKKEIPVFFSFDNNYVAQAAVTFFSLLTNAKETVFYSLYVLHRDISLENITKLKEQVQVFNNVSLSFIKISEDFIEVDFKDEDFCTQHLGAKFTVDTLYRCLPTLISEFNKYDKIIYSDVDIVVLQDISDLMDVDLSDNYLGGVKTPDFLKNELKHHDKKIREKYVAGGLWVMNLAKMRADNLIDEILSIIKKPPYRLLWNDQDVINLACRGNVTFISYDYMSIPDWTPMLMEIDYNDLFYPNKSLYSSVHNPRIIHYAGRKPWKDLLTRKSEIWYYWLDQTVFYNQIFPVTNHAVKEANNSVNKKSIMIIKYSLKVLLYGIPLLCLLQTKQKAKRALRKLNELV